VVFPWIPFLFGAKKRLSDIEFLSIKDFDGKRVDADGAVTITNTTTETDVVTVTAGSGKDMYLAGAVCTMFVSDEAAAHDDVARLVVNATPVEIIATADPGVPGKHEFNFITKGVKVAATQIIKLTFANGTGSSYETQVKGKLLLFEEATGDSPQIG